MHSPHPCGRKLTCQLGKPLRIRPFRSRELLLRDLRRCAQLPHFCLELCYLPLQGLRMRCLLLARCLCCLQP